MSKTKITYYMDIDESGAVRGAGRVDKKLKQVDDQTERTESRFRKLSGVMTGAFVGALGLAFGKGMNMAIDKGGQFQSKLSALNAITGISGDRLQRLGDRSLELSSKYGTAASDVVEANKLVASQLAQKIDFQTEAGFQQLQKVTEQAIVLQKAAGIPLQNAVDATARSINQFNLRASQGDKVINTLAAASKYGAAEIPYVTEAMVNAGTAAHSANQGIGITSAAIEELAAKGQRAETAGRSLRAIFTRLQTKSKALAEAGINNVNIKTDGLIKTLHKLRPLLQNTTALTKIFGQENINQIQILINNADAIETLHGKMKGTNTAYKQAKKNMDNFTGAMDRLWQTITNKAIVAFNNSADTLTAMANGAQYVIAHLDDLAADTLKLTKVLASLTAGYYAYKNAVKVATLWDRRAAIARLASITYTKLATLWERRAAVARLASMRAQKLLNLAMEANPIAIVIGALTALVGILYSNSKAWQGFKTLISGVWDFLKQVFFNIPELALKSFKLLGEIFIAPFKTLQHFAGNVFSSLTDNFFHFLKAIKKGITGDFAGAWDELSAIGKSAGKSFIDATSQEMSKIGDRVNALVASADFGPAIAKMAHGTAKIYDAALESISKGGTAGAPIKTTDGKSPPNQNGNQDGSASGGASGADGTGSGTGFNDASGLQAATAAQVPTVDLANLDDATQRAKKMAKALKPVSKHINKQNSAWDKVAGKTGEATKRAIEYSNSVGSIIKKVISGLINQVVALWVRNAVQTAGASGPAALFVTPALTAVATKAAHAIMNPLLNFEGGGLLEGPRHRNGGIRASLGGRDMVELEGGEHVTNRWSTRQALPLLDAINSDPAVARQISESYVSSGGALTINALPASSKLAQTDTRDIASEVSRAVRAGLQAANIVAPVQLRTLDEEQSDERGVQTYIGNNV